MNYNCVLNDVSFELEDVYNMAFVENTKAIGMLRRKTSLTLFDACELVEYIIRTKSVPETFECKYPFEDRSKYDNVKYKQTVYCQYCNSPNTKKISFGSKAVSTALFGIFAMNRNGKQYHCNNCGSDF